MPLSRFEGLDDATVASGTGTPQALAGVWVWLHNRVADYGFRSRDEEPKPLFLFPALWAVVEVDLSDQLVSRPPFRETCLGVRGRVYGTFALVFGPFLGESSELSLATGDDLQFSSNATSAILEDGRRTISTCTPHSFLPATKKSQGSPASPPLSTTTKCSFISMIRRHPPPPRTPDLPEAILH